MKTNPSSLISYFHITQSSHSSSASIRNAMPIFYTLTQSMKNGRYNFLQTCDVMQISASVFVINLSELKCFLLFQQTPIYLCNLFCCDNINITFPSKQPFHSRNETRTSYRACVSVPLRHRLILASLEDTRIHTVLSYFGSGPNKADTVAPP